LFNLTVATASQALPFKRVMMNCSALAPQTHAYLHQTLWSSPGAVALTNMQTTTITPTITTTPTTTATGVGRAAGQVAGGRAWTRVLQGHQGTQFMEHHLVVRVAAAAVVRTTAAMGAPDQGVEAAMQLAGARALQAHGDHHTRQVAATAVQLLVWEVSPAV
jgi:hypothetical protein